MSASEWFKLASMNNTSRLIAARTGELPNQARARLTGQVKLPPSTYPKGFAPDKNSPVSWAETGVNPAHTYRGVTTPAGHYSSIDPEVASRYSRGSMAHNDVGGVFLANTHGQPGHPIMRHTPAEPILTHREVKAMPESEVPSLHNRLFSSPDLTTGMNSLNGKDTEGRIQRARTAPETEDHEVAHKTPLTPSMADRFYVHNGRHRYGAPAVDAHLIRDARGQPATGQTWDRVMKPMINGVNSFYGQEAIGGVPAQIEVHGKPLFK